MCAVLAQAGNAKIKHLRPTLVIDENVAGLEIAMDDAAFVRVVHRTGDLDQQAQARSEIEVALLRMAHQVIPAHVFQRQPRHIDIIDARLAGGIQAGDAGMLQLRQHFNLATHALDHRARQSTHNLERDLALRMDLLG